MANPVQAHPEADKLQAFSRGALADEAASQWISSHLESCPACLRTLESLSSDTLESLVRAAQKPDATADFDGADDPNVEADDLSFLAQPQAPDEIGRLGPYRVLKVLGSGGMGIVFQAEDVALKRRVALKVMKPQAARRPKAKERFLREAQAAAAIEHDHIVTIHQVGEERGVPFLAMQWLKGMSLEDRLRTTGDSPLPPLNTQHIVRIGQQIAVGLAAAHEQGLIHRDIKPANLWLTPVQGGRIKILDFGLARALADDVRLTQSGTIVGTPAYMAPEQGRGDNVDHRCDLFSLGVVLYRLTTGRLPFRGDSTMAVLTSLAMDTPEPPRKLVAALPVELSDLIMQMLSKDPAQRPATARAVADRLRDIDQQLGTPRLQPEQTEALPLAQPSGKKPLRKWPIVIAASLGALALLAAATVFFLQTSNGTVRIEINDDSIEATLTKNGAVIKGTDKSKDITVATGEQTLKIKRGDLEFETDKFVLKKDDTVTLKIELLPGKVQVVQGEKVIGEKVLPSHVNDRKAVVWVLSLGGSVTIFDGQQRYISEAKHLPADPWILREIDLWAKKEVDDASLKELAGLKNLQTLSLGNTSVSDAGMKELVGLRNLGTLNLGFTKVTGAGMKELAGLQRLQWLDLRNTKMTDAGLKELAGLESLHTLNLGNTRMTDAGLKELANLKRLQSLYLWGAQVTDAGLLHLQHLANLKTLDLNRSSVTAKGIAALQKALPGCEIISDFSPAVVDLDRKAAEYVLSIGGTVLIDDGQQREVQVRSTKNLPAGPLTLRNIHLSVNQQVDDAGLKNLAGLKSLRILNLEGTKVTAAGLKQLAGLKELTRLSLGQTSVTDAGLKPLATLKNLQMLNLNATATTDAGLKDLTSLENLYWLQLADTKVTNAGLKNLARLTRMQDLNLSGTSVTDAGLKELAVFKSLRQLSLSGTKVTDEGLVHLQNLTNLKTLDLTKTKVTAQGSAALHKALPDCRITRDVKPPAGDADRKAAAWVLSLGGTVVIDDGQERNVSAAKDLPAGAWTLQKIDLNRNKQVDDAGLKELAGLKRLHVLYLYDTKVTNAGLKELANLKSLQELNLDNTQMTDAGLKELAGLNSLHTLNLGNTRVTDAGLKELANLKSLRDLVLFNTEVTDAGLKELAALKSLSSLYLAHTDVTDAGLAHLQTLTNLKTLDLAETKATAKGIAALQKALPGCKIISE